jgi:hypothetical protein
MSIQQVGEIVNLKDTKTIVKWLKSNKIATHKITSKVFVLSEELYLNIYKPYAKSLMLKYPNNWKDRLKVILNDEQLFKLILLELEQEVTTSPQTWVKTRNKHDEKLLFDLGI